VDPGQHSEFIWQEVIIDEREARAGNCILGMNLRLLLHASEIAVVAVTLG
jgi:hypothetical protein